MQYITPDFLTFFTELEKNNNTEWFHANKKRYEKDVKKPFYAMLQDLIGELRALDDSYQIEPKDCVGRINRDIRFSKDKTPYNTHYTAFLSSAGKKDKGMPGIYIRVSHEAMWVMTGTYGLEKDQLQNLREAIADDPKKFRKLIEDKAFAKVYGEVQGEENKRLPSKELQAAAENEPLLLKKQFYFVHELKAKAITSENLIAEIVDLWKLARPVNDFLKKALQG